MYDICIGRSVGSGMSDYLENVADGMLCLETSGGDYKDVYETADFGGDDGSAHGQSGRPKLSCGRPEIPKQSAVACDLWDNNDRLPVMTGLSSSTGCTR